MWSAVQERLTMQIASALSDVIQPTGVGVVVEATWVIPIFVDIVMIFLDRELISYSYSSCSCSCWVDTLQKGYPAPSFQGGPRWNLAACSSSKTHRLTESIFDFDVTLSRWRSQCHFTQQSAATWWVTTKRPPAPMQQRPPVPDLYHVP